MPEPGVTLGRAFVRGAVVGCLPALVAATCAVLDKPVRLLRAGPGRQIVAWIKIH